MVKTSIKLSKDLTKKLHEQKHELRLSSVEEVIIHLMDIFEEYKKMRRVGFTDEEKKNKLREQGKEIINKLKELE